MSFDAYLQRADDYILKQIQKFEQQKRGNRSPPRANGYRQMPRYQSQQHGPTSSQGGYPSSPAPPGTQYLVAPPPSAGPMFPEEWAQEFDAQSQRWYYVHKPTGTSQWNPPSHVPPPRAATFQPDTQMPSSGSSSSSSPPYQPFARADDEANLWTRSNSQPQRPGSTGAGHLSPGLAHTQLPPGTHLDMKTGQIVTTMFPQGQTPQSWAHEVQRI